MGQPFEWRVAGSPPRAYVIRRTQDSTRCATRPAGLLGTFSVVSANAWMNQPADLALGPDGRVAEVQPLEVSFNPATGYEVAHMFVAAYMVTGFLVASVYLLDQRSRLTSAMPTGTDRIRGRTGPILRSGCRSSAGLRQQRRPHAIGG
jgi:hypothetical protein